MRSSTRPASRVRSSSRFSADPWGVAAEDRTSTSLEASQASSGDDELHPGGHAARALGLHPRAPVAMAAVGVRGGRLPPHGDRSVSGEPPTVRATLPDVTAA
eukprot:scaffold1629_cov369-Prasinococcus_capsulatus_cf.AAC.35